MRRDYARFRKERLVNSIQTFNGAGLAATNMIRMYKTTRLTARNSSVGVFVHPLAVVAQLRLAIRLSPSENLLGVAESGFPQLLGLFVLFLQRLASVHGLVLLSRQVLQTLDVIFAGVLLAMSAGGHFFDIDASRAASRCSTAASTTTATATWRSSPRFWGSSGYCSTARRSRTSSARGYRRSSSSSWPWRGSSTRRRTPPCRRRATSRGRGIGRCRTSDGCSSRRPHWGRRL